MNKPSVDVDEIKVVVFGGGILRVWFLWDYLINSFISVYVSYVFCNFHEHVPTIPVRYQREIFIVSTDFYVYYFEGCVESKWKNWSFSKNCFQGWKWQHQE